MKYVYVVMSDVPYEDLEGVFSNRDSAAIFAEKKCKERIEIYSSGNEPCYEKRSNGYESFSDGVVRFWFYKVEVQD
jgi:hypothetical protein